ncbi:MAG TPA: hypothetical protein VD907_06600 [Verrucomicrobiae bacterium]|nr:hypothetical protein [Verrucomicrobiae bacterium]
MITHSQIERRIFPIIRRGLRHQVAPVLQAIEERGPEYANSQLNRLVKIDPIYLAFNDFYPKMLILVARNQYNDLERKKDLIPEWIVDAWNQFAAMYLLTDIFTRMASITETTRRRVARVILDEGEGQNILNRSSTSGPVRGEAITGINRRRGAPITLGEAEKQNILSKLSARDFIDPHALTIARTEATTILNTGVEQGASGYGRANEVTIWHGWIPMEDDRTRPAHFAMRDVRPIPLGDRFEVGGELLRYPGDPEGSPGNTINCRCRQLIATEQEVIKRYGIDYVESFSNVLI